VPKFTADFSGMIHWIPKISLRLLRRLIRYLRQINRWKKEHQDDRHPSKRRAMAEMTYQGQAWRM
jgi:hypothetical protein